MTQPFTSASEREALLPTGWVLSGGSEAGKLSSSSSPSNFSSLFSTLAFGRLRGPSVSPPRLVWALPIENLLSNGVRRSNRQDIGEFRCARDGDRHTRGSILEKSPPARVGLTPIFPTLPPDCVALRVRRL